MATLKDLSNDIAALVEKASKSVVRVDARRGRAGTGIVWDAGLVLTANHVVEQEDDIQVVADDKSAKATLVGRDPATDLALLKVEGLSAPAMPRGKVDELRPGQIVLAIGRPGSLKATFGTISAVSSSWRGWRGSEIEHLIQTNAPLYPGFSGGPLVDVDGRAIGMNSWVFGRGDGRAIAMDVAERVIASLKADGRIRRPYLGIGTQEVALPEPVKAKAKQDSGLLIVAVEPQSPADKAGLMQGDTLVALNGTTTSSLEDLYTGLRKAKVGATQTVRVVRAGELKELEVTVGEAGQ
ncbi:MAG: PDZ domain-containing protein [Chloroflexota bacterium]|nr:MAG: PDZ domain-containing protein [Chloroflexota bacterium]